MAKCNQHTVYLLTALSPRVLDGLQAPVMLSLHVLHLPPLSGSYLKFMVQMMVFYHSSKLTLFLRDILTTHCFEIEICPHHAHKGGGTQRVEKLTNEITQRFPLSPQKKKGWGHRVYEYMLKELLRKQRRQKTHAQGKG